MQIIQEHCYCSTTKSPSRAKQDPDTRPIKVGQIKHPIETLEPPILPPSLPSYAANHPTTRSTSPTLTPSYAPGGKPHCMEQGLEPDAVQLQAMYIASITRRLTPPESIASSLASHLACPPPALLVDLFHARHSRELLRFYHRPLTGNGRTDDRYRSFEALSSDQYETTTSLGLAGRSRNRRTNRTLGPGFGYQWWTRSLQWMG